MFLAWMKYLKKLDQPGEDHPESIVIKIEDNLDCGSRKSLNPDFCQRGIFLTPVP